MLRSGMGPPSLLYFQRLMDSGRCFLAVRDCVYHFAAAVYAVATGVVAGVAGAHGLAIYHNATVLQFEFFDLLQKIGSTLLAERLDHHADLKLKSSAQHGNKSGAAAR